MKKSGCLSAAVIVMAAIGSSSCRSDQCPDREPLICDALYLPYVVFSFVDVESGDEYCGPATIRATSKRCDWAETTTCNCDAGVMVGEGSLGSMGCHINPPEGERTDITVSVIGYEDFETDVSLAYECQPREYVEVLLSRP